MEDAEVVRESMNLGLMVGSSQRRITEEQTHAEGFKG